MAIISIDALWNAGRVQQGLSAMVDRLGAVGQRLRGVETTANKARAALRGMNAEQLSGAKIQPLGGTGTQFASAAEATGFRITGTPGQFGTFEEATGVLNNYRSSLEKVTQATGKQEDAGKKLAAVNRRQGVSFTQLLGLMIKFGIAMEIINLPGRVVGLFANIVRGGSEAEAALAGVNALLRVSREEIMDLGRVTRDLAADLGVAGDVFAALEEAASSIGGFPVSQVRRMRNGITLVNTELQTTVDMFELAAKAAVAGGAQIEEAMRAVTTITSGFNVSVQDSARFMDVLFKVVDKGNVTFAQLSRSFGELTGGINLLSAETDENRKFFEFRDVLTGIAVATRTLQPAEAFTAVRNLLRGFADSSAEGLKLRNVLKQLGVNLTINDIAAQGFGATIEELSRTIGPNGKIIDQLVDRNRDLVDVMGEANFRQAQSLKIIQTLFPNIRSIRGLQAIWNNDLKLYKELSKDIAQSEGELNKQLRIRQETLTNATAAFKNFAAAVKEELFFNIGVPIANALRQVNMFLQEITSSKNFRNSTFIGKLTLLWKAFTDAFNVWWRGGGQVQIFNISETIGKAISDSLISFFSDTDQRNIFIGLGVEIGLGISKGIIIGVGEGLLNQANPLTQVQRLVDVYGIQGVPGLTPTERDRNFREGAGSRFFFGESVASRRNRSAQNVFEQIESRELAGNNYFQIENVNIAADAESMRQAIVDAIEGGSISEPRDDRINNINP